MLPRRARVDLGAMAMKGCSVFPKAPALLGPHHQTVWCHNRTLIGGGSYPSAEVLFTNPSARAGYDTRSIFKRSLTGFEFRVFLLCRGAVRVFWLDNARAGIDKTTSLVFSDFLGWFLRWEAGGRVTAVLSSVASRICSKWQHSCVLCTEDFLSVFF